MQFVRFKKQNAMMKALISAVLFLLLFCVRAQAQVSSGVSIKNKLAPETFNLIEHRVLAPQSTFLNERGQTKSLEDFKGKILIVNILTTSCPQCITELPMLDRLQKDMGSVKFHVIALSSDLESLSGLRRFYGNKGVKNLDVYADTQGLFAKAADVRGLPTTFLIDDKGRIAGRIRGVAEWDSPKIKAQIRELIRASRQSEKLVVLSEETIEESSSPSPSELDIKNWFTKK